MPRSKTTGISRAEQLNRLREGAEKSFDAILTKLKEAPQPPQLFPSGIELVQLTLMVGGQVEFTVIVAGKDAPSISELTLSGQDVEHDEPSSL